MSIPSSRWPYGPAHEQPPRDWIPNRSLSTATTKLWWRYRPSWRIVNDTIDSRGSVGLPRTWISGTVEPRRDRPLDEVLLAPADRVDADRLLELEHEPRPDRLDDRGRAALLAVLRVVEVDVLERVDVGDGAAAR